MSDAKKIHSWLVIFDVFSLLVWAMLLAEFFTKGRFHVSIAVSSIYLLILAYYVGDKELRRWRKKYYSKLRHGEYFVYLWGMTLFAIVGYYVWGGREAGYLIPGELPTVAGSVIILYFLTEYLKEGTIKKDK